MILLIEFSILCLIFILSGNRDRFMWSLGLWFFFYGSLSNPVDGENTSTIVRRCFLVPSHSQAT